MTEGIGPGADPTRGTHDTIHADRPGLKKYSKRTQLMNFTLGTTLDTKVDLVTSSLNLNSCPTAASDMQTTADTNKIR